LRVRVAEFVMAILGGGHQNALCSTPAV
jgi:hypothetical protein